jgi:hypothetical protein
MGMTKVYSLAMFDAGDGMQVQPFFYWHFFPGFLRGFYSAFPDWELWIYHDSSLYHAPYGDTLVRLAHMGKLKLILMPDTKKRCEGMLWRMLPIWQGADVVACRDVDGLPYPREYKAVEDWIKDGKTMCHVIHDSESHHGIMGGTSTWRASEFRDRFKSWDELVMKAGDLTIHGSDQNLLNKVIEKTAVTFIRNPPHVDKRDGIGPHIGAGFSSNIIVDWFDRNEPNAWLRSCERAYSNVSAVMSCDGHPQYMGGLPLTCKVWYELMNARALIIMTGDKVQLLRDHKRVIDWCRDAGARIFFTPISAGWRPATSAQVGRLFAHTIPWINDHDDYLITTDADMWPLSSDFFAKNKSQNKMTLWYANAYGAGITAEKFPLCYVGATPKLWREVMSKAEPMTFQAALADALQWIPNHESMTEWCHDEVYFSMRVRKWPGFPTDVHFVDRHGGPPKDRIDRSNWPSSPVIKGMVDAHLVRPPERPDNWIRVEPILKQLMTDEGYKWCQEYVGAH